MKLKMTMRTITTVSSFQFADRAHRWKAFTLMPQAPEILAKVPSLDFGKMLGSGAGQGFSVWPDWSTYFVLACWSSRRRAEEALEKETFWQRLRAYSTKESTLWLKPYQSKGSWNGINPFPTDGEVAPREQIAVLTRASIKPKLLHRFWWKVPGVSRYMKDMPGLLYAKGIGERPLLEQATISIWDSAQVMKAFAYQGEKHAEVVRKTRELDWYKEELFARFQVEEIRGSSFF